MIAFRLNRTPLWKPTPGVGVAGRSGEVGRPGDAIGRLDQSHAPFAGDEEERGIRIRHELLRPGVVVHQQLADGPAFGERAGGDQPVEVPHVPRVDLPDLHPQRPQHVRLGPVRRAMGDAHQVDAAPGRPIGQLLRIAGGLVPGNPGRPVRSVAGIEVVEVPGVLALLDRRGEDCPGPFAAESGRLPQGLSGGGQRLVGDLQIDLLIRGIVGERPPVLLPPRLPSLRLSGVDAALQDLPPRVFAETHAEQLGVVEILPGQAVECADDLTPGPPQVEVRPSLSSIQIVRLHEVGQSLVADDQPVVAAAGEQGLRDGPDEGRHGPRIADRPQGESQAAQHPVLGGPVELVAQLRHRLATDGDELAHQQAPQLGLVDGVIELAEFEEDLRRPIGRLLRQGLDELAGRLQPFSRAGPRA